MRRGRLGPGHVCLQQVLYLLYICMEITAPVWITEPGNVRGEECRFTSHDNTDIWGLVTETLLCSWSHLDWMSAVNDFRWLKCNYISLIDIRFRYIRIYKKSQWHFSNESKGITSCQVFRSKTFMILNRFKISLKLDSFLFWLKYKSPASSRLNSDQGGHRPGFFWHLVSKLCSWKWTQYQRYPVNWIFRFICSNGYLECPLEAIRITQN